MQADEQICLIVVCHRGASFVVECNVGIARQKNRRAQAHLKRRSQPASQRKSEILFIDGRSMGQLVTRVHRVLTDQDVGRIATTYHAWRGEPEAGDYGDVPGFCRSTLGGR